MLLSLEQFKKEVKIYLFKDNNILYNNIYSFNVHNFLCPLCHNTSFLKIFKNLKVQCSIMVEQDNRFYEMGKGGTSF